jgi:hypothetical protein
LRQVAVARASRAQTNPEDNPDDSPDLRQKPGRTRGGEDGGGRIAARLGRGCGVGHRMAAVVHGAWNLE